MIIAVGLIVGALLHSLVPLLSFYRDVIIMRHIRDLMDGCSPGERSLLCRELVATLQVSAFREPDSSESSQQG